MLTQEFFDECWSVVLQGINRGLIICPPLEKCPESKNHYRAVRACSICKTETKMNSVWQKMCQECSIKKGRDRDRKRREKLKLERGNQISNSKIQN